ncbi:MAG: ATP-dependent RecD-like DNA helicase [Bacteroidales bacterium]|nr:ATP-dependent RecD-like DNA helicase [Bacteroidales bacterium]
MSKTMRCVVEHITFQSAETGYSVLRVSSSDYKSLVTVVGNFLGVGVGTVLQCEGDWKTSRFGQQFECERWEEVMPATAYGIEKYLGSGLVKGIGPRFARLIVAKFGTETIHVIENDIKRLYEVEGIGKKRVEQIQESWAKQKDIKNVMLFLQGHGVSVAYATKIYGKYGQDSVEMVKSNPYRLADEIWGIGFKTADGIAQKLGYEKSDPRRCRSGLLYMLQVFSEDGHCFGEEESLVSETVKLLEADEETIRAALEDMCENGLLVREEERVYLPAFFKAEKSVAEGLAVLVRTSGDSLFKLSVDIDELQREAGVTYDEVQIAAIRQAIASKVMVLTGGPGTGKTTTTRAIIAALEAAKLRILLAAPTGRAAKRMSEATGKEAKTIHRLLEYNPQEGCNRNADNPLEGDVLIVDECSMIDLMLMYFLVKAIPPHMRLVMVGDTDQLPSVGAGNVLRDIILSKVVPVVRLTRIFRQAQSSRIVMNAHAINQGRFPDISNGLQTDFFFLPQSDAETVVKDIVALVRDRLPRAYKVRSSQIQVLSPMQRGTLGTVNLNRALQEALNPGKGGLVRGAVSFRRGDRVMQLKNNYDKDVYNGDMGHIVSIDREEQSLKVSFDGREVDYDGSDLDELTLSYATTIHKSQGSEFPIVVMPVLMAHFVMLQRNLIYTGITRAKKICVLVGETKALNTAIRNVSSLQRYTRLSQRLAEMVKSL